MTRRKLFLLVLAPLLLLAGAGNGSKDVTTAGTAERLVAARLPVVSFVACAKSTNTDDVYVGGSSVAATNSPALAASDCQEYSAIDDTNRYDLYQFWVNSAVNGEGVTFTWFTR